MEIKNFFLKAKNRLIVTLLLGVAFPVFCAAFFPIFVFLILPATTLLSPGTWVSLRCLHLYWLGAAGSWVALLAVILPQMRKKIKVKNVVTKDKPSDIDLKKMTSRGSSDLLEEAEKDLHQVTSSRELEKEQSISKEDLSENQKFLPEEPDSSMHGVRGETNDEAEDTVRQTRKYNLHEKIEEQLVSEEKDEALPLTSEKVSYEYSAETMVVQSHSQHTETFSTSQETYECSLPSPSATLTNDKSKNTVFIFVNKDDQ